MNDSLWVDKNGVTYAKYFGEGEWSYEHFTLEDIEEWKDEGGWIVQ